MKPEEMPRAGELSLCAGSEYPPLHSIRRMAGHDGYRIERVSRGIAVQLAVKSICYSDGNRMFMLWTAAAPRGVPD